jgi:oxygen-independent coproporphyrinogen-3 oxidase
MGRESFGDASTVHKLVRQCRGLGIATSADFLFNLPGQPASAMDDDVDRGIALGLDQICLYHLVLYEGLGTAWSTDPALVAAMPSNDEACANWLRLRGRLLAAGYVQSTLTNFERADVASGPQRFRYEVDSFSPEAFDAVGCGPMSLSTVVDWRARTGLKLLRSKNLGARPWSGGDLLFRYDEHSLRALFVVRSLAKTWLSTSTYAQLFGTAFAADFAEPAQALIAAGLVVLDDERALLTPRGMFFADTVVGALSSTMAPRGAGLHTSDLLEERPRTRIYLSMG